MAMNKSTVSEIIERSFSRGALSPVPSGMDPKVYISKNEEELRAALIDPVKVKIVGAMFEQASNYEVCKSRTIWAIARRDANWLLLAEETEEFALAFGKDPMSLTMHGFASDDALAEWLG